MQQTRLIPHLFPGISAIAVFALQLIFTLMLVGSVSPVAALAENLEAKTTIINGLRVRPSPERTRIVFDLQRPVEHQIFSLANPNRLVIDIEEASLDTSLDEIKLKDTPISSIRSSRRNTNDVRIVLDLTDEVRPRSFVLKPIMQYGDRLVIDLYTAEQQATPIVEKADRISRQMRDIVVAIDAGHGGEDPGAIGYGGLMEKDVALAIATRLKTLFENEPGFKAALIRTGDYYIAHRKRTAIARQNQADLFISIHADAFQTTKASGASVYAISQKGATSEAARWLAEKENRADLIGGVGNVSLDDKDDLLAGVLLDLSMTASLVTSLDMGKSVLAHLGDVNKLHKKNVEQAAFLVLKSPDIPSLLVETGYISNPGEAKKLGTESHQNKLAAAIFEGVKKYMQENPPAGSYLAWVKQGKGESETPKNHRIVSGDTLSEIAARYGVSSKQIKQVNGLRNDTIRIGQILKIPST